MRTTTKFRRTIKEALLKKNTHTFAECLDMCRVYIAFTRKTYWQKKISALNYTWSKNVHLMYIEQLGWWPNNDSNQYYGGRLLRPVGVEGWSWGRCCKKKTRQDINRVKVAVRATVSCSGNQSRCFIYCMYLYTWIGKCFLYVAELIYTTCVVVVAELRTSESASFGFTGGAGGCRTHGFISLTCLILLGQW